MCADGRPPTTVLRDAPALGRRKCDQRSVIFFVRLMVCLPVESVTTMLTVSGTRFITRFFRALFAFGVSLMKNGMRPDFLISAKPLATVVFLLPSLSLRAICLETTTFAVARHWTVQRMR